jgi:hypothetical protein
MINKGAVFTDKDLSNADKYDNEDEEWLKINAKIFAL